MAIARAGDRLVVEVRDDGVGGADAQRAPACRACASGSPAIGGTMYVISPAGRSDDDLGGAAVRIVIAEDSVLLRAGLTRILSTPARRSWPRSATPTS